MECWICGSEADSREHRIKRSDLKKLYPNISQKTPVYYRRNGEIKRPIGRVNSDSFKFDKIICQKCNNSRTQNSDNSWSQLSGDLIENWQTIKDHGTIDLSKIFKEKITENMVFVQQLFVKIFGCKVRESAAPIKTDSLSMSLLSGIENDFIYISFRDSANGLSPSYVAISDIEIFSCKSQIVYAQMYYTIGSVTVDIIFCEDTALIDLNGGLKPNQMGNIIKLSSLNYHQGY